MDNPENIIYMFEQQCLALFCFLQKDTKGVKYYAASLVWPALSWWQRQILNKSQRWRDENRDITLFYFIILNETSQDNM